jgi:hypothetical protein
MTVNNWPDIRTGYLAQSIKLLLNNVPRVGRVAVEIRFRVYFMVLPVGDG